MAIKVLKKVNGKLKFLYRQNKYLTFRLKRWPSNNALIQPHFDCISTSLKYKLQTRHDKCIRLCLDLPLSSHIGVAHFRKINWLQASERVESCKTTAVFKYWNGIVPE